MGAYFVYQIKFSFLNHRSHFFIVFLLNNYLLIMGRNSLPAGFMYFEICIAYIVSVRDVTYSKLKVLQYSARIRIILPHPDPDLNLAQES